MKKNKALKWEIKDVIAAALLSLFLILIQFIVNMVCMTNHFVSMVLSVGFTMFLCAPVYYLLLSFDDKGRHRAIPACHKRIPILFL